VLEHALAWAARGFRIFPLHPGTKLPVWKSWTEHATADPERIKALWSERAYNIGVLTDDMIVVDVDVKSGKDGLMSAFDLGLPFETLTVRTPSGGLHLYYSGPNRANSAGRLGDGLDTRSFHGFVVAPGSVYGSGAYTLELDAPIVPFPETLLDKLPLPRERQAPLVQVELDDPTAVAHARNWLRDHPGAVWGENGDIHTYKTAAKMRDFGLSEETAFQALCEEWNDRCRPTPWPLDMLRGRVANAYAYATGPEGAASPAVQFAGVVVEPETPRRGSWFYEGDDHRGAVTWLYPEILPTTGVVILTAPSGSGKTLVGLYLAKSLATGAAFFGTAPLETGGTLYLAGEAYGSLKLRMAALSEPGRRLPIAARYVGGLAARGAWAALCEDIRAEAAEIEARFGQPIRLIVLDTLSSSGILEQENDNGQAANVMKAFAELSQAMNALVLIIHHPAKDGTGARGAGAIHNNGDYVFSINYEAGRALREIDIIKSRDAETRALGTFTVLPVDVEGGKTAVVSPGEAKIKEVKVEGALHAPRVLEALDNVTDEKYKVFHEGAWWTEAGAARDQFFETWPGKTRERRNVDPAFALSLKACMRSGSIKGVTLHGTSYIKKEDFQ
jgi:hypothetical protein